MVLAHWIIYEQDTNIERSFITTCWKCQQCRLTTFISFYDIVYCLRPSMCSRMSRLRPLFNVYPKDDCFNVVLWMLNETWKRKSDSASPVVVVVGVTAGAWWWFSAALAMRMGGARAHQRSSPGRGVDAPRWKQGIGAIDVQTTLLPPRRVGSCPSPTFRSYVTSVGGGDGGIGWGLFGRLFGGGPLLLLGVGSCIKHSSEDGWAMTAFLLG